MFEYFDELLMDGLVVFTGRYLFYSIIGLPMEKFRASMACIRSFCN